MIDTSSKLILGHQSQEGIKIAKPLLKLCLATQIEGLVAKLRESLSKTMWIGRILVVGVASSYVARWFMSPQNHRKYVARWMKALRRTTGWLPRGRHKIRRFGSKIFKGSLHKSNRKSFSSPRE